MDSYGFQRRCYEVSIMASMRTRLREVMEIGATCVLPNPTASQFECLSSDGHGSLYIRGLQPAALGRVLCGPESVIHKHNALWILKLESLNHGRARVAHCVTGRWRNVSQYCRPLRLVYVFWAQRSAARCADSTRCTQTRVYSARGKYIVCHWRSREVSLRHSSGWGTWSVICAPVH